MKTNYKNTLYIKRVFLLGAFIISYFSVFSQTTSVLKTIIIDAGHGGKDPGCKHSIYFEKDITLSLAKKLQNTLKDNYPDLNIILTRTDDTYISLKKRAKIANNYNADLFISLHVNALPSRPNFEGSETFVLGLHRTKDNLAIMKNSGKSAVNNNSDEANILLNMMQSSNLDYALMFATMVENRLRNFTNRPRSVIKQAGFAVLRETTMPSVLIETGFITNDNDRSLLISEDGQNTIVIAILNAFMDYKFLVEQENASNDIQDIIDSFEPTWGDTIILDNNTYLGIEVSELDTKIDDPNLISNNNIENKKEKISVSNNHEKVLSSSQLKEIITKEKVVPNQSININKEETKVLYYVQLAASKKPMDISKSPWNSYKTKPIIKIENNFYKYLVEPTIDFEFAEEQKLSLRKKGFKGCFVVAYKDGHRIKIE